ncbi:MAG: phosphatase PAP2 family protein [Prevotellaceae bacterium]|nr:phosphatase PAP2 family protein [Prevotellaceae bacterium]
MFEKIIECDKQILLEINSCNSTFSDHFFWIFTQLQTWIPAFIVIAIIIIRTKRKDTLWILFGLVLTVVLADQIASSLIKPLVERLRPSREPSLEHLLHLVNGYTGGRFGFVSSHAANSFGIALFLSLLFRKAWFSITIFAWACLNSYSRMYLGVHYPSDIICGAIIGLGCGYLSYFLLKNYATKSVVQNKFTEKDSWLIIGTLLLSVIAIIIFNQSLFSIFS